MGELLEKSELKIILEVLNVSYLRQCYGMLLEKGKKTTSAIVTVVVSVKIRSWTSLKQKEIQHFEAVWSMNIL